MRCTACGVEMILTNVVPENTVTVCGFEHHTFICSACHITARRVVFTRHGREEDGAARLFLLGARGRRLLAALAALEQEFRTNYQSPRANISSEDDLLLQT
jgi:molybdenum-dependent DNA-binding transcriptional regulator ModE